MLLLICENHQPRLGAGQVLCFPLKTNVNFGSLRDLLTVFTSCLKALSLSISALIIITLCLQTFLLWNDDSVGIKWPLIDGELPLLSSKDSLGKTFADSVYFD